MSFDWLIGYDKKQRLPSFDRYLKKKSEIHCFEDIRELIKGAPFPQLGITEDLLCQEIFELIRQRLLGDLMPECVIMPTNGKISGYIKKHLECLGISDDEGLVSAMNFIAWNIQDSKDENARNKEGINSIYYSYHSIYSRILHAQNGRCACCGEKIEYGRNMELDHILPAHLGDDAGDGKNWQLLCNPCNNGKNEYLHYISHFSQVGCITATFKNECSNPLRYATLERDKQCMKCGKKPKETELFVYKKFSTGLWVLDNTICYCKKCASELGLET